MKEGIAFSILCIIVLWSAYKGYQRWKQGKFIQSLVLTFIAAWTQTQVIAKLGEWLCS